ncbi:MAG TPA: hypothetical protein VFI14_05090, partial [Chryseosolibacter sp.]|nr:hypothetical protein [Chryseosolibacter sp.]
MPFSKLLTSIFRTNKCLLKMQTIVSSRSVGEEKSTLGTGVSDSGFHEARPESRTEETSPAV